MLPTGARANPRATPGKKARRAGTAKHGPHMRNDMLVNSAPHLGVELCEIFEAEMRKEKVQFHAAGTNSEILVAAASSLGSSFEKAVVARAIMAAGNDLKRRSWKTRAVYEPMCAVDPQHTSHFG